MKFSLIKRSLSLLEVLIAFSLMAVLAGVMLGGYRRITLLSQESRLLRQIVLERKYTQERLGQIFAQMSSALSPAEPIFFTPEDDTSSLHFIFDNGIDPDPLFCHGVKGILSLSARTLILTITPLKESDAIREEILLKNIDSLAYQFLDFGNPKVQNHAIWPIENKGIPALMILECSQNDQRIDFSFFLNAKNEPAIVYYKDGSAS